MATLATSPATSATARWGEQGPAGSQQDHCKTRGTLAAAPTVQLCVVCSHRTSVAQLVRSLPTASTQILPFIEAAVEARTEIAPALAGNKCAAALTAWSAVASRAASPPPAASSQSHCDPADPADCLLSTLSAPRPHNLLAGQGPTVPGPGAGDERALRRRAGCGRCRPGRRRAHGTAAAEPGAVPGGQRGGVLLPQGLAGAWSLHGSQPPAKLGLRAAGQHTCPRTAACIQCQHPGPWKVCHTSPHHTNPTLQALPASVRTGGRPSREEALQSVAVINRIRRLLSDNSGE